jgi:hypothetical protein
MTTLHRENPRYILVPAIRISAATPERKLAICQLVSEHALIAAPPVENSNAVSRICSRAVEDGIEGISYNNQKATPFRSPESSARAVAVRAETPDAACPSKTSVRSGKLSVCRNAPPPWRRLSDALVAVALLVPEFA